MKKTTTAIMIILSLLLIEHPITYAQEENQAFPAWSTVAAGMYHAAYIKNDSSLWVSGYFDDYNLTQGTAGGYDENDVPKIVAPTKLMDNAVSIYSAFHDTFVKKSDGSLWGWGDIPDYLFKSPPKDKHIIPSELVDGIAKVWFDCVLMNDGNLWSSDERYKNENNSEINASLPNHHKLLDDVTDVTGSEPTFALKNDNTLWGFGDNYGGALGDGTEINRIIPVQILDNVKAVSAGSGYAYALKTDGTLWHWGDISICPSRTPYLFMEDVLSVYTTIGSMATFVIKKNGTIWGWHIFTDYNDEKFPSLPEEPFEISSDVVSVASSLGGVLFVKEDGSMWCISDSSNYVSNFNITDEISLDRLTPIQVMSDILLPEPLAIAFPPKNSPSAATSIEPSSTPEGSKTGSLPLFLLAAFVIIGIAVSLMVILRTKK